MDDELVTAVPVPALEGPAPAESWIPRGDATRPLHVLVVARQPIVRAGLRGLLAERGDLLVVGASASIDDADRQATELRPDIVLVAWEPGDVAAVVALVEMASEPVVLFGDVPTARELRHILRAGARGFLLSDATADELAAALQAVAQGLLVMASALERLLSSFGDESDQLPTGEPLTEREREVLQFLAQGLPNKTIASRLRISEHTVKFHVGSILAKMDAASRTEAVTRAARQGLVAL